jgi:hypothetical protein
MLETMKTLKCLKRTYKEEGERISASNDFERIKLNEEQEKNEKYFQ